MEAQDIETLSKKIKHCTEDWREIILHVHDILLWKNFPLYPAIISVVTTIFFIFIVFWDPTLLSFFSNIFLVAIVVDYMAPIVMSKIFSVDAWTGPKEKKFDEICSQIAAAYIAIKTDVCNFYSMKDKRPKIFYAIVSPSLLLLSWLGNNVNNIFLTYIVVTYLLLLPGLKHNGYLQKAKSIVQVYLAQVLRSFGSKKNKKQ